MEQAGTRLGGVEMQTISEPLFKARPATEGDDRFLYCEPSTEDWDLQNERTLAKALMASAPYFLKFGVIDIGHFSIPEIAKKNGIEHPELYKVGHPVDVRMGTNGVPVVKAAVYRGEGHTAEQANILWEQLNLKPAVRYYPSIGGKTFGKSCTVDGCTLTAILWSNVGLWQEPINVAVKAVTVMPMDVFAKALIAGAGTDVSLLEGSAALRRQSHEGHVSDAYYRVATRYLRGDTCPHTDGAPSHDVLKAHFRDCGGFDDGAAAEAADRLIWEIATVLKPATTRLAA